MEHRTRNQDLQLAEEIENLESFTKETIEASGIDVPSSDDNGSHLPGRDENTKSVSDRIMEIMEEMGAQWDRVHPKSQN